jgi:hypothetical protein
MIACLSSPSLPAKLVEVLVDGVWHPGTLEA